jgi:hypothetical protein
MASKSVICFWKNSRRHCCRFVNVTYLWSYLPDNKQRPFACGVRQINLPPLERTFRSGKARFSKKIAVDPPLTAHLLNLNRFQNLFLHLAVHQADSLASDAVDECVRAALVVHRYNRHTY